MALRSVTRIRLGAQAGEQVSRVSPREIASGRRGETGTVTRSVRGDVDTGLACACTRLLAAERACQDKARDKNGPQGSGRAHRSGARDPERVTGPHRWQSGRSRSRSGGGHLRESVGHESKKRPDSRFAVFSSNESRLRKSTGAFVPVCAAVLR